MARQPRSNAARGTAAPRGQGRIGALLTGLVIGILLGLAVALGVALYLNRGPNPFTERKAAEPARPATAKPEATPAAAPAPKPPPQAKEEKDTLQFHEILRGPKEGRDAGREPKPGPAPAAGTEQVFYLQVASLSSAAEADTLKVQLTLAGFEPRIQSVQLDGGKVVHRVRLGPFASLADAENALVDVKRKNQIEGRVIKEQQSAPRSAGSP